jgi:hypothetical protein
MKFKFTAKDLSDKILNGIVNAPNREEALNKPIRIVVQKSLMHRISF